ncbi:MFS transporter [Microbispora sp. NBRC 16548]|uniref:MFS transporter n=1 Tax=Microbispora sp. NBRC 16548 TaxID=3030994 RepID=UPI0024A2EAB4|nr:hypothetical protein Misp03_71410 [Microbispora sp. NBRC 16548]
MTVGTAAVHETRKGGRTTALILATAGFAVNFWAWALLSPLSSTYKEMLRLTPFEASVLVAIPVIVGSLGRIVLGALTDRYGGRLMFAVASMLGVVPVVFLAFAGRRPAPVARPSLSSPGSWPRGGCA